MSAKLLSHLVQAYLSARLFANLTMALTSSGAKDFLSVPAWTSTIGLSLVPAMTSKRMAQKAVRIWVLA